MYIYVTRYPINTTRRGPHKIHYFIVIYYYTYGVRSPRNVYPICAHPVRPSSPPPGELCKNKKSDGARCTIRKFIRDLVKCRRPPASTVYIGTQLKRIPIERDLRNLFLCHQRIKLYNMFIHNVYIEKKEREREIRVYLPNTQFLCYTHTHRLPFLPIQFGRNTRNIFE